MHSSSLAPHISIYYYVILFLWCGETGRLPLCGTAACTR